MIDLASNGKNGTPVFLSEIARRQSISEKYLEHIFSALHKSGIVKAQRGRRGGYLLSRTPDQITLNDILSVLEGPCNLVDCVSDTNSCSKAATCVTREVWTVLGSKIEEVLNDYTLASLVRMQQLKSLNDPMMYYI
jgi:Rrf2 family protein